MPNTQYYPSVTRLLPKENIPAGLGVFETALETIFDNLFYRDHRHFSSQHGDVVSHQLTLISLKEIGFEVPGTGGLGFVLNPGVQFGTTELSLKLQYELEIKRYLKNFKISEFAGDPMAFFNTLLEVFGIDPKELLEEVLEALLGDNADPLQAFVDAFNGQSSNPITSFTDIDDVITQIEANADLFSVIFDVQIGNLPTFDEALVNLRQLFAKWIGKFDLKELVQLFIPKVQLVIGADTPIQLGLKFPRTVLVPLDANDDPLPEPAQTILTFDVGRLYYSTETSITFESQNNLNLPKSGLLSTGFTVEALGLKLDLSRDENIPEAIADGRPADFVGLYITDGTIGLPKAWTPKSGSNAVIKARNLLVGTGGLSGTLGLEMAPGSPTGTEPSFKVGIGGFTLDLYSFSLTFQQNAVVGSDIRAKLTLPWFKDENDDDFEVEVLADFDGDGDFSITLVPGQAIPLLRKKDVFSVNIKSLEVGRDDGEYYLEISGDLQFEDTGGGIGKYLSSAISLTGLRIWENGKVELKGGAIPLPKALTLNLGPAKLSITAIHFGTHEQMHGGVLRQYNYFGFDGGVSLDPGGVDARGDGIKFYYTSDELTPFHFFIGIEGIGINLMIPGTADEQTAALILKGYLAVKNPDDATPGSEGGKQYVGAVSFSMPKMKMGGSAAMRLNPKNKSFIVDAALELSTPIMLGTTGLGIYGFRGLVGKKYVVSRTKIIDENTNNANPAQGADDVTWWEFYKKKGLNPLDPNLEGVNIGKFDDTEPGFSIGAGISLATAPDSGKAFSSKLFLLLSLPEVLLLQGQAAVAAERIGLDSPEEPPFRALLAIDSDSVQAGFGFTKKIDDDGKVLNLNGELEMAYFFKDSSAWYINAGRDLPEEKRISARILSLVDGYAYLMLSAKGIKAGAGASYELKKKYGPVSVDIGAFLDIMGFLNFKPTQIGGSIDLGAYAKVGVFGFSMGFELGAGLAAEAPKPFIIQGYAFISIDLPWPFKDYGIRVEFVWERETDLNTDPVDLMNVDTSSGMIPAQAVNILSQEAYPLAFGGNTASLPTDASFIDEDDHTIPMDSYIDLEFAHSMLPDYDNGNMGKFIGVHGSPKNELLLPPNKSISEQVIHQMTIKNVLIKYWSGTAWEDYDPYAAATPVKDLPGVQSIISDLPWGSWQWTDDPDKCTRLRILANNPFSYMTQGSAYFSEKPEYAIEDLGINAAKVLCPKTPLEWTKRWNQNWQPVPENTLYEYDEFVDDRSLTYRTLKRPNKISYPAWWHMKWMYNYPKHGGALVTYMQNAVSYFADRKGTALRGGDGFEIYLPQPVHYAAVELMTFTDTTYVDFYHKKKGTATGASGVPKNEYEFIGRRYVSHAYFYRKVWLYSEDKSIDKMIVYAGYCTALPYTMAGYFTVIKTTVLDDKTEKETEKGDKEAEIVTLTATLNTAEANDDPQADVYRHELVLRNQELDAINDELNVITTAYNDIDNYLINYGTDYNAQARDVMASYQYVQQEMLAVCEQNMLRLEQLQSRREFVEANASVEDDMIRLFTKFNGMLDAINNFGGTLPPSVATDISALKAQFEPVYDQIKIDLFGKGLITEEECVFEADGTKLYCFTTKMLIAWQNYALLDVPTQDALTNDVLNVQLAYRDTLRRIYLDELHAFDPLQYPQPGHFTLAMDDLGTVLDRAKWLLAGTRFESDLSAGLVGQLPTNAGALDAILTQCDTFLQANPGNGEEIVDVANFTWRDNPILLEEKAENAILAMAQVIAHPQIDAATKDALKLEAIGLSLAAEQIQEELEAIDYYGDADLVLGAAHLADDETLIDYYNQQVAALRGEFDTVFLNTSLLLGDIKDKILALSNDTKLFEEWGLRYLVHTQDLKVVMINKVQLPSNDPNVIITKMTYYVYRMTQYGYLLANNVFWGVRNCFTWIYDVFWNTREVHIYEQNIRPYADIIADTQNMIQAQKKVIQPTWRPNTKFLIQVQTNDHVIAGTNTSDHPAYQTYGFMTKGPIGHYHKDQNGGWASTNNLLPTYDELAQHDREKEFKLASLKEYIDYNRSYPNPNGNLVGAKPMYYENITIDLYFTWQYVYQMYSMWEPLTGLQAVQSDLKVLIKDPAEDPVSPPSHTHNTASFELHNAVDLAVDQQVLNNVMGNYGPPCTPSSILPVRGKKAQVTGHHLKPEKLYSVVYIATYQADTTVTHKDEEVYKHVFKTSRYASFSEHIQSFIVGQKDGDDVKALFPLQQAIDPTALTTAQSVVQDTMPDTDSLIQQFPVVFERLMDGVFQFGAMEDASGVEVNQVIDTNTGNTIGLWVRSPEPLNDPRLGDGDIGKTLKLMADQGSGYVDVDTNYVQIHSKDVAQIFVTNNAMNITDTDWEFKFRLKRYDEAQDKVITTTTESFTFQLA